jgi:hypothetical protein
MSKRKSQPPTFQLVPEEPEEKRRREIMEKQGEELRALIKKINSHAIKAERKRESDDAPELPPAA